MSDVSKFIDDLISAIHGKPTSGALAGDAQKLLGDVEKVAAGVGAASKDVPGLAADIAIVIAEATALAASKGLDLPALVAAASTLQKTAGDLGKAVADFRAAAAVVAAAPAKTP
jgi:hypothetical protein